MKDCYVTDERGDMGLVSGKSIKPGIGRDSYFLRVWFGGNRGYENIEVSEKIYGGFDVPILGRTTRDNGLLVDIGRPSPFGDFVGYKEVPRNFSGGK